MNQKVSTRAWQFTSIVMTGSVFAVLGLYRLFSRGSAIEIFDLSLGTLAWFLFETLPLLLIIPGIVRGHAKSIFWATLVSMLYFIEGVYFAAAPVTRSLGISETVFALGMFISCTYLLRGINNSTA